MSTTTGSRDLDYAPTSPVPFSYAPLLPMDRARGYLGSVACHNQGYQSGLLAVSQKRGAHLCRLRSSQGLSRQHLQLPPLQPFCPSPFPTSLPPSVLMGWIHTLYTLWERDQSVPRCSKYLAAMQCTALPWSCLGYLVPPYGIAVCALCSQFTRRLGSHRPVDI